MRNFQCFRRRGGFSLLELMVGAVIVAILAAVGVPSLMKYIHDAKEVEGVKMLLEAKRAQDEYRLSKNAYAITFSGGGNPGLTLGYVGKPKFNLIIGDRKPPILPSGFDADWVASCGQGDNGCYTSLGKMPEFSEHFMGMLTLGGPWQGSVNRFGTYLDGTSPRYLIGAEADLDGDDGLHVMAIDDRGVLYKLCSDYGGSATPEVYNSAFGTMPSCDKVSASEEEGGIAGE